MQFVNRDVLPYKSMPSLATLWNLIKTYVRSIVTDIARLVGICEDILIVHNDWCLPIRIVHPMLDQFDRESSLSECTKWVAEAFGDTHSQPSRSTVNLLRTIPL